MPYILGDEIYPLTRFGGTWTLRACPLLSILPERYHDLHDRDDLDDFHERLLPFFWMCCLNL